MTPLCRRSEDTFAEIRIMFWIAVPMTVEFVMLLFSTSEELMTELPTAETRMITLLRVEFVTFEPVTDEEMMVETDIFEFLMVESLMNDPIAVLLVTLEDIAVELMSIDEVILDRST